MKAYKPAAAVLVLVLHSMPLVSCALTPLPPPPAKPVPVHTVWASDRDERLLGMSGNGLACKKHYRGIGVRTTWTTGAITEVAAAGPAERAGVLVGDHLLTEGPFDLPVGTKVNVRLSRDGREYTARIAVDDVCFAE